MPKTSAQYKAEYEKTARKPKKSTQYLSDYEAGLAGARDESQSQLGDIRQALGDYRQWAGAASTAEDRIRQALKEKTDYNKAQIGREAEARAGYVQAGPQARARYSDIVDPTARAGLVAQDVQQALGQYLAERGYSQAREGTISDLVGQLTKNFQGQVEAQRGGLEDLMTMYGLGQSANQNYLSGLSNLAGMWGGQEQQDLGSLLNLYNATYGEEAAARANDQWQQTFDYNKAQDAIRNARAAASAAAASTPAQPIINDMGSFLGSIAGTPPQYSPSRAGIVEGNWTSDSTGGWYPNVNPDDMKNALGMALVGSATTPSQLSKAAGMLTTPEPEAAAVSPREQEMRIAVTNQGLSLQQALEMFPDVPYNKIVQLFQEDQSNKGAYINPYASESQDSGGGFGKLVGNIFNTILGE